MSGQTCLPPREIHGYGAFLRYYDNVRSEWVVFAGTSDLSVPAETRDKSETNGDDGDGTTHYIPSPQADVDDSSYEADFIKEQFRRVRRMAQNAVITCWQVVANTPQQEYWEWCGYVSVGEISIPKKDIIKGEITVHHTGGGIRTGALRA